jgi:hypothetical protein
MTGKRSTMFRDLLLEAGYIDAEPVRRKLLEFTDAGITVYKVARTAGIPDRVLHRIATGSSQLIRPEYADSIHALTEQQIHEKYQRPEPYADEVVVQRLLRGIDIDVPAVDKPAYARALYAAGWNKNQIALRLAMSWTKTCEAIGRREVAA